MSKASYSHLQKASSPSRKIRDQLDYPVIDTDLHTVENPAVLEQYIEQYGNARAVDQFREALKRGRGSALSNRWYEEDQNQRVHNRTVRPPWWALPAENTLDLATVSLPQLLHERLQESGSDYAILYPNVATFAPHIGHPELRRIVTRAVNHYNADLFRPYADRLTPVAAIPLHTPEEGLEELDYAINTLGLKVALIPGHVTRPIPDLADKLSEDDFRKHSHRLTWIDTYGLDSAYDYDPFWARAQELGVSLTTHSAGMGWTARSSISNYMYNHIGHFADASHALAKSLFLGGVTHRFPDLRFGLLEAGAAWGASLLADLVGHWEKRNGVAVQKYDPAKVDQSLLVKLYNQYGSDLTGGTAHTDAAAITGGALGRVVNRQSQDNGQLDDFAAAHIDSPADIVAKFVPNFYFGAEADDPSVAYAFNQQVNPEGARLNAFWASDSGHWDVPDLTQVLAETWQQVERGALSEQNFKDLVFSNPHRFYSEKNPDFFKNTAVQQPIGNAA